MSIVSTKTLKVPHRASIANHLPEMKALIQMESQTLNKMKQQLLGHIEEYFEYWDSLTLRKNMFTQSQIR